MLAAASRSYQVALKFATPMASSLSYVYSRENPNDAHMAKVLTVDEARRIASNIAKLPTYSAKLDDAAAVKGSSGASLT